MNRRASASCLARSAGSSICISEELPRSEIFNPWSATCCLVCAIRPGANSGLVGKSRFPSNPLSSIAAKPFVCANCRIFFHSHAGHPKVENASGNRSLLPQESRLINAVAAPAARNSLRVITIGHSPSLLLSALPDSVEDLSFPFSLCHPYNTLELVLGGTPWIDVNY